MSTFTDLLPATKSESQAAIDWTPADQPGSGLLLIKTRRDYCEYRVSELRTEWDGRAFRLDKITLASGTDPDESAYHVFVCKNAADRMCECRGHVFQGVDRKHLAAILTLVANDWL